MVNRPSGKESSPAVFLVIILFILVPPLGLVAAIALAIYNKSKQTSAAGNGQPRTEATRPTHVSASVMENGRPKVTHGHTPNTYSYDGCAVEKRLAQLDALKKAGLLENEEYARFRQKIVNGA